MVEDGGRRQLTRAAVILFGADRCLRRLLPRPVLDYQRIDTRFDAWSAQERWHDRLVFEENLFKAWRTLVGKYSRMPISSQEFQIGLAQRFVERDGMYFLADQAPEYDRMKLMAGGVNETMEMFVKDEASMIHWLRQLLKAEPQTFSGINPQFMQHLGGWSKNEAQLDLRELL